jgi:hypothetical protein
MKSETIHVGGFDARPSLTTALNREQWARELHENLVKRDAIFIIDARIHELPPYLQDRLTPEEIRDASEFFNQTFGPDWQKDAEGKTFAVTYAKYGHGHKHQAYDFALALAHITKSRVIFFDPMDALPDRERQIMIEKKNIHKAMQTRNETILDELKERLKQPTGSPAPLAYADKATNTLAYQIANLAWKFMPAKSETGNDKVIMKTNLVDTMIKRNPVPMIRSFVQAEALLTERSVSAATATIAAQYDADAIITTHPYCIRALTPDVLTWVPQSLHKQARHALQTIITLIPDNGYTRRNPDGSETRGLPASQIIDDIMILAPFASVFHKSTSWLARALHIVADDLVADRFHSYWQVPREQVFPFGTVCNTLSPEKLEAKWNAPAKRILIASNGNGSNIPDALRAIRELAAESPAWLAEKNYHLDIFLADLPHKQKEIMSLVSSLGISEQVEIIDYTNTFFTNKKSFEYESDPHKRIHLAIGTGDAAGSELKQLMQRAAHIEIRSPGENAPTGAKVGTIELCTPPGGPNEIYNMIWSGKRGVAYATNWNADTKAVPWQKAVGTNAPYLIPDTMSDTFVHLVDHILTNEPKKIAHQMYDATNKGTVYAIIGLLIGEIRRRETLPTPDRHDLAVALQAYMKTRNPKS